MGPANPFRSEPRVGDWLLAVVIGAAAVGALLWGLSRAGSHGDLSNAFVSAGDGAGPPDTGAAANPATAAAPGTASGGASGTSSANLATMAVAAVPSRGTVVIACTVNGKRVYSDTACGPDARTHDVDEGRLSTYAPPSVDTTPVPVTSAVVESPPVFVPAERSRTSPASNDAACDAIQREIDGIDARMRQGYRSPEGERLRARRQDAKDRFHEYGCTWHTPG